MHFCYYDRAYTHLYMFNFEESMRDWDRLLVENEWYRLRRVVPVVVRHGGVLCVLESKSLPPLFFSLILAQAATITNTTSLRRRIVREG